MTQLKDFAISAHGSLDHWQKFDTVWSVTQIWRSKRKGLLLFAVISAPRTELNSS
ncbi:hypothetical protein SAMN05216304_112119 [Bosea sp. OK403]|uniref:hypothetical protein n=1 Tax=Bosea sp. OK403 TaxID=1855286 RepID=UPI0008E1EBD6|nr:hypothetical protein [Bosea sp. OK403]SFJ71774.1 hypothetical protein SAMN05216304_112119 [Bosea sp. OK403]